MKTVLANPILFSICGFLFLAASRKFFFLAFTGSLFLWIFRTRDRSWMITACFFLLCSIPRWSTSYPAFEEARAVKVTGTYAILQNGRTRVLIYTDQPLQYDGIYHIEGDFEQIQNTHGFYRLQIADWASAGGCYYIFNPEKIEKINQKYTFKSLIQMRIEKINDSEYANILYRVLLNIRMSDDSEQWYYDNGFSIAGVLTILSMLLGYFTEQKKRNFIMLGISIIFAVLYGFQLLIVSAVIFRLLSFTKLSRVQCNGLGLSIIMLLYPSQILTISFLIPAVYRISCCSNEPRYFSFFCIMMIQSIMFQQVSFIQNVIYPYLQRIFGLLYLTALIELIIPVGIPAVFTGILNFVYKIIDLFTVDGSIFGLGIVFFILFLSCAVRNKHFFRYACGVSLIFFCFGLFHPFAEITFINVGQGDSILLRMPLNSANVLIDTGKPSALNSVVSTLKAKGIRHLDGLIITHQDNDHSGNQEYIAETYNPKMIITEHHTQIRIGSFLFEDLNDISNEDENESSIVEYVALNGMKIVLTGDIDQKAEKRITVRYPALHADILKLAHHGSKTGTSDQFLNTLKPYLAVISSGKYSLYHHPSPETIQRLLQRHIPYYDTKNEGDISIVCIGKWNVMITSSWKIAIINES